MRRILPAFLLIVSFACPPQARAQTGDPQAATPSGQVRATARKLLASGSPEDAAKAADLLARAAEIDEHDAAALKAQAETAKLKQPPESESGWKVLVDITPFLSFVIVALGFFVNNAQARTAEREKREEAVRQRQSDADKAARELQVAEEARWSHAVTLIQKSEDFSPAAAILSTFLSGSHAALARNTAVSVMLNAKKFSNFSDLFNTFIEPVTQDNLQQVLTMLRSVSITVAPLLSKSWVNETNDPSVLTPAEADSYHLLVRVRTFLGAKAAAFLRQKRQSTDVLDFSDMGFDGIDLSNADLRNCIAPSSWNFVNLDGADLRGMRNVADTWVYSSAWWHAAHIDAGFLDLLIERSPFKPGQASNTPRGISAEDYRTEVARLKAELAAGAAQDANAPAKA
jgi:uncharacterized protein YjbI with pentapeptide repeats